MSFISAPSHTAGATPYFRKSFPVAAGLSQAWLRITALGVYVPFVNGHRVGEEVLAPGWTSYKHRLIASDFNITLLLKPAQTNTLGAIVGEGWAAGDLTWLGLTSLYTDRPALHVELVLRYDNGEEETISTDTTFQTTYGAFRYSSIYHGEHYDARLEPRGWSTPDFDDREWKSAEVFPWSEATIEDPIAQSIRRMEEIDAVALSESPTGTVIVDFGQVVSGWGRLSVSGLRGDEITLRYAEHLAPDGTLDVESNRTAQATDRYVIAGTERETWEPSFTFHGFRYIEVTGWPGTMQLGDLRAVVVHTDMDRTGWFECSDPLINRWHENALWSMRGNFVGIPTDCPQRDERMGWTGDLNAFTPVATFLYDVKDVLRSWLRDLKLEQDSLGTVPWVVPNVLPDPPTPTALWSDCAISLPWALYQEYGDIGILHDCYNSMAKFMDEVISGLDGDGLWTSGFQFGDWLDPDAPTDNPMLGKTDPYLVSSAFLCKISREMTDTAQVLSKRADTTKWRVVADRARSSFRTRHLNEEKLLRRESATGYALAIEFGIFEEEEIGPAANRLATILHETGYTIPTGFAGTPHLLQALTTGGQIDAAYRLATQTHIPSFLYSVTMGATTIWERWDSVLPDGSLNSTGMTSLNHYALGGAVNWLHRHVAGLKSISPGWERIQIAPKPGGALDYARASHTTTRGNVTCAWRIEDGEMTVTVNVPNGSTAIVTLPGHPHELREEVDPGTHEWKYKYTAVSI